MFGRRSTPAPTYDRASTRQPGMRPQGGVSPLMGGVVGTVIQNVIARKLANKVGARFGGLPGMLIGMGATYAINRLLNGRKRTR